jgi:hypothetical protein
MPLIISNEAKKTKASSPSTLGQAGVALQQDAVLSSKTPQEFKRQLHGHMLEKEREQALEARRHAQAAAQAVDQHQANLDNLGAQAVDAASELLHRAARTGDALRDAGASEIGTLPPQHHHADMVDLDAAAAAKRKIPASATDAERHPHRRQGHRREAERKAALRAAIFRSPGFASSLNWQQKLLAPLGSEARQALGFFLVLVLPISLAYLLLFSSYRPSLQTFEDFFTRTNAMGGTGPIPAGAWDDGVGTCWFSQAAATAAWTQPTTFQIKDGSMTGSFVHCDALSNPNGKCYLHGTTAGHI